MNLALVGFIRSYATRS